MATSRGNLRDVIEDIVDVIEDIVFWLGSPRFISFLQRPGFDVSPVNYLKALMFAAKVQAADAEEKQTRDPAAKQWLDCLKICLTESRVMVNEIAGIKSSSSPSSFLNMTMRKIKETIKMLETLLNQKDDPGLKHDYVSKAQLKVSTTAVVEAATVDTAAKAAAYKRSEDLPEQAKLPIECIDRWAYCTFFPHNYELKGDTLIQLWMAANLIPEEPMEDLGALYLNQAQHEKIISLSGVDCGTGKTLYRVNKSDESQLLRGKSTIRAVTMDDFHNDPSAVGKTDSPCHAILQSLPTNYTLEMLGRFPQIRSVLLLQGHMSDIDCLPYDCFISLEFLQALDLSGTKLSELPSSIGNARCLCYLDLSDTPIKQLPETIDSLETLQTLKLRNCFRLNSLPRGTRQLTSLRHLDLGTLCCLDSMPPKMGALTQLRTLSNFVVGEEPGCHIAELKHINDLRGRLCLSNLEYVASPDEAREANLSHKRRLTNLELRWTSDVDGEGTEDDAGEEVIEHLRPHTNLRDLRILCYGGSKFPSWISNPCFDRLVRITLFRCENCQVVPSLGQLPGLEVLSLIELLGVKIIDFHFGRDVNAIEGENFVAFPNLQKLTIKSMASLKEWRDMGEHDFPRLTKLKIKDCPELVAICRLSNFHSLQHLEINRCSKLWDFPGDLPASVKAVVIGKCPSLSLWCLEQDKKDSQKT